jgi:hypothetical protein
MYLSIVIADSVMIERPQVKIAIRKPIFRRIQLIEGRKGGSK